MAILRATITDVADIAILFINYLAFYGYHRERAEVTGFLEQRLLQGESAIYYAADAGRAVGFVQLYPLFSSIRLCRIWVLNDLFVSVAHRRKGYGRALLERAKLHAFETGARGLFLQTSTENATAQALYESQGYVRDVSMYRYDLTLTDSSLRGSRLSR